MRLIILKGKQQSGRTSIISQLLYSMLMKGAALLDFDDNLVNKSSIHYKGKEMNEFIATIQIFDIKIGFISNGDNVTFVRKKLNYFNEIKTDILIVSCRSLSKRGSTYQMLLDRDTTDIKLISVFHSIFSTEEYETQNQKIAESIESCIEQFSNPKCTASLNCLH